jgi:general secretion pathway protein G
MIERLQAKRNEEGFTLIELLIVIIILGILAAIVVFAVGNAREEAAKNSCKTELKSVQLAAEAVKTHEGSYPATEAALANPALGGVLKTESSTMDYTFRAAVAGPPAVPAGYTITPNPAVTGCDPVTG